jgi:hypothetical protein
VLGVTTVFADVGLVNGVVRARIVIQSLPVDTSSDDGVDAIDVAIQVAVVVIGGTISNGEVVEGTELIATVLYATHHDWADQDSRPFHCFSTIWKTP